MVPTMRLLTLLLILMTGSTTAATECRPGQVLLQVLGSGGPELDDGRASSGYLIWVDGRARILIDTGAGSAQNFERSGARIEDLQALLFTHLHVDHSVDFPAYVKGAYFSSRSSDLPVFGPVGNTLMPATTAFIQHLLGPHGAYRYLSEYVTPDTVADFHISGVDVPLQPHRVTRYTLADDLMLSAIPVSHGPVAAVAWRIDIAGCALTFSGDMSNDYHTLATLAADTDLLIAHNAVPEGATGIARRLHMPPTEIGRIAAKAQARSLVLSHRMRRTLGREPGTLAAIRGRYSGPLSFADDMDCYDPAAGNQLVGDACPSANRDSGPGSR